MKAYTKNVIAGILIAILTFLPCSVVSVSAESLKMGDVDNNGKIEIIDALLIQRNIVRLVEFNENQKHVADINGDGRITLIDAMRILRFIVGYSDDVLENESENQIDPYVQEVVRLINEERAKENLSALILDENLCKASSIRAKEIVTLFSHTRPDGTSWASVFNELNLGYMTAGENIAAGYATPKAVVEAWMNSQGHRANIMSIEYTKIGVGYYYDSNSSYGHYWQQLFVG